MKNLKSIFTFIILAFAVSGLQAQDLSQKLPVDPKLRTGKLDNGLTYYIRNNAYPEKRASFYIAQKVGSMQEEDSQAGLAHFLEHMAFNGTKNYPGRGMVFRSMETYGVKFGRNMNAYTSFDETVYNISDVPTTNPNALDSALLVIHDWSSFITLNDEDIDKERGIIKEEWRTRSGAQTRIWEKTLPILYQGSKYGDRLPIGKMSVVEKFEYQALKNYYKKWYRPDLQAVIVVGDIDVDAMEAKVKAMFADIPKPVNPAQRIYYPVADNEKPIFAIVSDPEKTTTDMTVFFKHEPISLDIKQTQAGYKQDVVKNIATEMLADRLREIAQKADAPITGGYAIDRQFFVSRTKDAWMVGVGCQDTKIKVAFETIINETERVKRFGYTQAELDRTKANIMTSYQNMYNNRNKSNNSNFEQKYVRAFTQGESTPGIDFEFDFIKQILPTIDLKTVENYAKSILTDRNIVIQIAGPEKEGLIYPTEAELLAIMENASKANITAYTETLAGKSLVENMPKAGKIVKEEKDAKLGATVWTLSNGVKVVLKKTDFKDDEIIMTASSKGGTDIYTDKEINDALRISAVTGVGGVSEFSTVDLQKMLAGKRAFAMPSVSGKNKGFNGMSSTKDFETLLQLVYLNFTAPRKDVDAFSAYKDRLKNQLKNASASPNKAMSDSINFAFYGNNPRKQTLTLERVDQFNYDRIIEMYKEQFGNANGFVFTFVGTVNEAAVRPLVEQYLASLPSAKIAAKPEIAKEDVRKGVYTNHFENAMKEPKSSVFNYLSGTVQRNQKNEVVIAMLRNIMDMVFMEKVREEMSGTYGVRAMASIDRYPAGFTKIIATFDTDPEKANDLNKIIKRELNNLATEGPRELDFTKTKEYLLKDFQEKAKQNRYWAGVLDAKYFYNEDNYSNFETLVNSITREDIKKLTHDVLSQKNSLEVIMMPKK